MRPAKTSWVDDCDCCFMLSGHSGPAAKGVDTQVRRTAVTRTEWQIMARALYKGHVRTSDPIFGSFTIRDCRWARCSRQLLVELSATLERRPEPGFSRHSAEPQIWREIA